MSINNPSISKELAQKIVLNSQGLVQNKNSHIRNLEKLSYVQLDTISVAERAHHHVLFTRNRNYQKSELQDLMKGQKIFEYWSHAAAFLPIEDYKFSLYRKAEIKKDDTFWFGKDKKVMSHVLNRIKKEGALQSKDFKDPREERGNWFQWKPAKIALTLLFMEGRLMIKERQGFQKVFDIPERVLPKGLDTKKPTLNEYCKYLILRAVRSQGLVSVSEICYLRKGIKPSVNKILAGMCAANELLQIKVEDSSDSYYTTEEILNASSSIPSPKELHILSPFDNLIIQRKRALKIFDFDYQIECYLPEQKRTYGYFALPILYGQKFVGRLDPKADRKTGVFHIKNLHFEKGFLLDDNFLATFNKEVKEFVAFCGCKTIKLEKVKPIKYKQALQKILE